MKLTVIIPSEDWRHTAGVRIRYDRLAPELAALGHRLELQPITAFRAGTQFDSDAYLFSKTYDVGAVVLARQIRASGRRVGVDVFDDYFSQSGDSRLVHMRRWFSDLAGGLDFALCATLPMAKRLNGLIPGIPVHVVNDPAGGFDRDAAAANLARNAARARKTRRLDIGWFGIGDNPYFSVGLEDLHAFSQALAAVHRPGYEMRLRVLTNLRALTPERLEMLARIPVPLSLEEWSEEAERALIADSLACFLPVNGQPFSSVKSLNRALSVLTGGCQVLSVGHPLYQSFDAFLYRDLAGLVADLERDRLRLSTATLDGFADRLSDLGDARHEAAGLVQFLQDMPAPRAQVWPARGRQVAVMHGMGSTGEVHKTAQRLGCLSVAAPQSTMKVNYDVIGKPRPDRNGLDVILSKRAAGRLTADHARRIKPAGEVGGKPIYRLHLQEADLPGAQQMARPARPPQQIVELARYGQVLHLSRQMLEQLFGPTEILLSERMSPYWDAASAAAIPATEGRADP